MLIKDFFKNYEKDEFVKNFAKYIKEENIKNANKDCPYIKQIVESKYNTIKKEKINKTIKRLRKYNVAN